MAAHVVTAPLIITKREDGSDLYLYEGAELPDFIEAEEVKRLTDLGLVGDPEADAKSSKSRKSATSESN
jgi:hypothetical protein